MGGTLSSWGITGIFAEEVNFQRDLGNGWPAKVGGAAWSAGRGAGEMGSRLIKVKGAAPLHCTSLLVFLTYLSIRHCPIFLLCLSPS